MKVQHIQTLVAIADAGSLRGAADALGKSQPALTKALRQAEEDLGVPIFQRSSRDCAFRGDPATCSDSIRPPVPI